MAFGLTHNVVFFLIICVEVWLLIKPMKARAVDTRQRDVDIDLQADMPSSLYDFSETAGASDKSAEVMQQYDTRAFADASGEEAEDLALCDNCGAAIAADADQCGNCGTVFADEAGYAPCPDCGKKIPDTSKKCPHCGLEFE